MNLILGVGYALIGLVLIFRASPLSIRYDAWTTGLRERHPHSWSPSLWPATQTVIPSGVPRAFSCLRVLEARDAVRGICSSLISSLKPRLSNIEIGSALGFNVAPACPPWRGPSARHLALPSLLI